MGLRSRLPITVKDLIQFRKKYLKNKKLFAWRFTHPKDASEVIDILILSDLNLFNP